MWSWVKLSVYGSRLCLKTVISNVSEQQNECTIRKLMRRVLRVMDLGLSSCYDYGVGLSQWRDHDRDRLGWYLSECIECIGQKMIGQKNYH